MKHFKVYILSLIVLFFCVVDIFSQTISSNQSEVNSCIGLAQFSQTVQSINLDSNIDFLQEQILIDTENSIELQRDFFYIFDYEPNTENRLIDENSIKNIISVKSEGDVSIDVLYQDFYGNEVLSGYPRLYYRKKDTSNSFNEIEQYSSRQSNEFNFNINLDYGIYEYYVSADNEDYPNIYNSNIAQFVVTERPTNFQNLNTNLQDDRGNSTTNLEFRWNAQVGVDGDELKYNLFIGKSVDSMQQYNTSTLTQNSCIVTDLEPRTRYYWKVEVENQYGAKLLNPQIFNFVTIGEVVRVYNAPNPFNPQKNQKTRIFFEMTRNGSAEINIYSEYGDKIRTMKFDNLSKGTNEIEYDGKDDTGRTLYNGTYLCILNKKCDGNTKTEKCRLLIIK